jgi:hypothetical protein
MVATFLSNTVMRSGVIVMNTPGSMGNPTETGRCSDPITAFTCESRTVLKPRSVSNSLVTVVEELDSGALPGGGPNDK